ncbi:hypothetical protein GNX71_28675 [Variovorax sp. RKNM96]|uniref:hypothetical protein n=1 Tax=Variovorax sp. RKNM96 TaxID=2681552 RepID=UPI00197E2719|nr:hypothetical protein [Variovorax sp. RKNM96]QSI33325.1 hypothetical protein GNX71_28675 [Variovorax sp. RKNM96]
MNEQQKKALEELFSDAQQRKRREEDQAQRAQQELADFHRKYEEHLKSVVTPTFMEFQSFLESKGIQSYIDRRRGDPDIDGGQGNPQYRFEIGKKDHEYTLRGYIQIEADNDTRKAVLTRKYKDQAKPVDVTPEGGAFKAINDDVLHDQLRALLVALL